MSLLMLSVAVCSLLLLLRLSQVGRRPLGLPPGPPTLPPIGNLHLIPQKNPHLQYQKWARGYGPIYSLVFGTKIVIVLSSDQVVKELLDKRGAFYSSRPESYTVDIATGGLMFLMMPYDATWKLCHRLFAKVLSTKASQTYVPYQDLENKQMLHELLDAPRDFETHLHRMANSTMTSIIYGFRTPRATDARFRDLWKGNELWGNLFGRAIALLPDLYPILRRLPNFLLRVRPYARSLHERQLKLYLSLMEDVVDRTKHEEATPCFASNVLKAQQSEGISDDQAAYICGVLLGAGSDTSARMLLGFAKAMILFPDVQKRAQEELDQVCGSKMPTKENAMALPYVRPTVKELCRWFPTAILGVPHAVTSDDEYQGYKIPKGATVIYNVWAIHMDPKRYANPRAFDPSRYLGDDRSAREALLSADAQKRDHFLFGVGRRACPGIDVGENGLFLTVARLLWAFDIRQGRAPDGSTNRIDPEDLSAGIVVSPAPFHADIKPRSEEHVRVVRREWEMAQELLDGDSKQWRPDCLPSFAQFDE